ncbi:MAG: molybdopterin-dependent oxidoreductase [Haliscomenobacter sp.]|nr:molybdopterin-dependent oxidoreductase [Haliscomenobacter sp.]
MATRRDFIKITGLGVAGLTVGGAGAYQMLKGASLWDSVTLGDAERVPTYCEVCFWKCAGWTYKNKEGKIMKVVGHEDDPHCDGRLCPRGTGGIGMYYDTDRLTTPLIRVTENGKQSYRKASWDEALGLIVENMKAIAEKYGPESVALFNHGSSGDHFERLFKAFGSGTIAAPSYAQCRGPREAGFKATFGTSIGSPEPTDIRDTRCLVLIGSHIGENMHNGQVQEMSDAIDRGADIITVDPRYSTAASKSKFWLPIKPATDLALLLAWIHVIIEEGGYDKAYVEQHTTGFDRLKHHVRRMTPEWAYGITTIDPETIRQTARLMGSAAPAVIVHPGRHVTWYGDDTQRSRAIAILNALLGSWGRRGGFFLKEKASLPNYPYPAYPTPKWDWKATLRGRYPLADEAVTNALVDASLPGGEGQEQMIHGWIVTGTNLPQSMPEKPRLQKAIDSLDFIAVVDTMPMEITGYADVVLPECTYFERYDDLRAAPHREPNIALRMPAVAPLGESKPAWWMCKQLGERLGLGAFYPYEDYSEVLDWQLKQVGSSLEEMKHLGVKRWPRKSEDLYFKEGEAVTFNTPSGKIELYSSELESAGFDPLPNYTAHPEPPEGFYRLIYGRAPMHTFSRTANNPNLTDLMRENDLWMNPKVAQIWGIENGQKVWLRNQDGAFTSFPIKVRVTERIRWDCVYMVHGFGQKREALSRAFGQGASDSEMITTVMIDPIMGGQGMRGNFVTFSIEEPKQVQSL